MPAINMNMNKQPDVVAESENTPITFVRNDSNEMGGKRLSKGERLCRKVIAQIIKEKGFTANVKNNYRPDFLCNPKTKRNLELDIFIEIVRPVSKLIAVEFNGRQHNEYVPLYHKTRSEFVNQQYRDKFKSDVCKEKDIKLVIISHSDIDHLKDDEKELKIRQMLMDAF